MRDDKYATPEQLSNEQLVCRVRGHRWPDVDLNSTELEPGITSHYEQNRGVFQQSETCERCGKDRTRVTLPPGIYDTLPAGIYLPGSRWSYDDPDDWGRLRQDTPRQALIDEYDRRGKRKFYRLPRGVRVRDVGKPLLTRIAGDSSAPES